MTAMGKPMTDFVVLFRRNVKSTLRSPLWLVLGLFQPILYLLLFAPLLGGLDGIPGFPRGGAYTVFTPGLLVMVALFSTAYVGFGLVDQIRQGVVERMLVTPTSRVSILAGYVARDVTALLLQSTVVVLIALPLGLRVNLSGLLLTFAMMALTGALMSSVSYSLALRLKDENALSAMLNTFSAPMLLLSGITLPLTLAPGIIRSIAQAIPFSHEVTAARSLFVGNFKDPAIPIAVAFLAVLAALAFLWGVRSFRKAAV